jgi:hypothetical protein
MGELLGSSSQYSTWGKFRAPFTNTESYYGMALAAQNPAIVGSDHTKEYRAGQACYPIYDGGTYCYPPAYFVSEHGSMFRVMPYSSFGWSGAALFWQPLGYDLAGNTYNWYYGDPVTFYFYIDQKDQEQMRGKILTWDSGATTALEDEAFTTGQDYGFYSEGGVPGGSFVAIESFKVIT